jgi:hypothetical protein
MNNFFVTIVILIILHLKVYTIKYILILKFIRSILNKY